MPRVTFKHRCLLEDEEYQKNAELREEENEKFKVFFEMNYKNVQTMQVLTI